MTVHIWPHQFTTDGPDILRKMIPRARGRLLDVIMWLTEKRTAEVVSARCRVISEFNAQIRYFKLTTLAPLISGAVVHDVSPKPEAMPALEVFSVLSKPGTGDFAEYTLWPELRSVLENASMMFPNLRKLHLNTFHDAVPVLPSSASFSHLTKLILDGSLEWSSSCPSRIAGLLHCTPQLESLWMKHYYYDSNKWRMIKGRSISKIFTYQN